MCTCSSTAYLSIFLSFRLSVYASIYVSIYDYVVIYLCISRSACLFVGLPVCLCMYVFRDEHTSFFTCLLALTKHHCFRTARGKTTRKERAALREQGHGKHAFDHPSSTAQLRVEALGHTIFSRIRFIAATFSFVAILLLRLSCMLGHIFRLTSPVLSCCHNFSVFEVSLVCKKQDRQPTACAARARCV